MSLTKPNKFDTSLASFKQFLELANKLVIYENSKIKNEPELDRWLEYKNKIQNEKANNFINWFNSQNIPVWVYYPKQNLKFRLKEVVRVDVNSREFYLCLKMDKHRLFNNLWVKDKKAINIGHFAVFNENTEAIIFNNNFEPFNGYESKIIKIKEKTKIVKQEVGGDFSKKLEKLKKKIQHEIKDLHVDIQNNILRHLG